MIVYGQISCICLHANEGRESKTKDSVYNAHLNFLSFFSGKNVRIIQGKYGIKVVSPGQSCSSYPQPTTHYVPSKSTTSTESQKCCMVQEYKHSWKAKLPFNNPQGFKHLQQTMELAHSSRYCSVQHYGSSSSCKFYKNKL